MRSALPKVLQPLAGQAMLAHVLKAATSLKPEGVHVVIGHAAEQVREAFAGGPWNWVMQTQRLGTGHALQQVLPALRDAPDTARVLVLYGDVPLITKQTLTELLTVSEPLAVLSAELDDPTGYGRIIRGDGGRVDAIVEQRDTSPEQAAVREINTGVIVAELGPLRRWLGELSNDNAQGEFLLTDIFASARRDAMAAVPVLCGDAAEVAGANDPWQLAELERAWQMRTVRGYCEAGLRVADPARVDVRGELSFGSDVSIDVNVIIEGTVTLGDGVRIGPFTRLCNVDLAAGSEVLGHCDLDGVRSLGACRIGPFARLRPGTELAEGAHLGNFVETKKTRIGSGSKANHLTYLGDCEVGSGVNIGAGTITCNYDGVNKSLTRIEDLAFIGSNSSLVAPVTVGRGATVGAGSVISRDAPADKLSMTRAPQRSVDGWSRPTKRST